MVNFIGIVAASFLSRVSGGHPDDIFTPECSLVMGFFPITSEDSTAYQVTEFTDIPPKWVNYDSKFGNGCLRFNGVSFIPVDRTKQLLGSDDFTLEMFHKRTSDTTSSSHYLCGLWGASSHRCWNLTYSNSSHAYTFTFSLDGAASTSITFDLDLHGAAAGESSLLDGKWHHIAVVRHAGVIKIYFDGVASPVTYTISTNAIWSSGSTRSFIGGSVTSGTSSTSGPSSSGFAGLIDEYRLTVGSARYTANFTPPTVAFGRNSTDDPDYANVRLLLGGNINQGLTQAGELRASELYMPTTTSNIITVNGINTLTGTKSPRIPSSTEFDLLDGDFTIEILGVKRTSASGNWIYTDAYGNLSQIIGCFAGSTDSSWIFANKSTTGKPTFAYTTNGTYTAPYYKEFNYTFSPVNNVEYDFAVVREGAELRLYVDGVLDSTHDVGTDIIYASTIGSVPLGIMSSHTGSGSTSRIMPTSFGMKNFRISKGVARYHGSSYVKPSLPLPIPMPPTTKKVIELTGSGSWVAPAGVIKIDHIFMIGGGGSGGRRAGGGGGAGEIQHYTDVAVSSESPLTYSIGAGGIAPLVDGKGLIGGNTTFGAYTAIGGGGGGSRSLGSGEPETYPSNGGSGGGGGGANTTGTYSGALKSGTGLGHDGGNGKYNTAGSNRGGGGGGAGSSGGFGGASGGTAGGDGGSGYDLGAVYPELATYGVSGVFAGGGGGGANGSGLSGPAGSGGGGAGGATGLDATNGVAKTGSGGGGGGPTTLKAGNGGSGTIILIYYGY